MGEVIDSFSGKYYFLSNFYPSKFIDEYNIEWKSVEHYYQAHKCLYVKDFFAIHDAETPSMAKSLGRKIKMRPDWEHAKLYVMKKGVLYKFYQNTKLNVELIKTFKTPLIEGNTWHDNIWGNCICNKCVKIPGKNYLGKILMAIREYLG